VIEPIKIDRRTITAVRYYELGYKAHLVFDINISMVVTEHHTQVLKDKNGNRHVASFPEGVTKNGSLWSRVFDPYGVSILFSVDTLQLNSKLFRRSAKVRFSILTGTRLTPWIRLKIKIGGS
jgi:hypothetical protein